MIHSTSWLAIAVFLAFVVVTLGLSSYLGKKAKSSAGYFAAHGQIPWFVNGVAFAGDYLSAASFLGICGMIAFYGYDGFLYSIGYLAGWVVALFVIAEPMKRLGKFTFADALNSRFNSRGIKLAAGASTLAVSLFYLIPQMVGAGVLVRPLVGIAALGGRCARGRGRDFIVVTAGMVSTTWVQFIKGSLLIVFSTVLTVLILNRGFHASTSAGEVQTVVKRADGQVIVNGRPLGSKPGENQIQPVGVITRLPGDVAETGPLGPLEFFSTLAAERSGADDEPSRSPAGWLGQNHIHAEADPGQRDFATGSASDVQGHSQRQAVRQVEFPVADARAVLRHGVAAAHSDSLLHGEGRGGRTEEHDRGHRVHWLLLRAHAVHGPGRDDERRARSDRQQQHGGAAARAKFQRTVVRSHFGDRVYDGAGNRERTDPGVGRRGDARSVGELRRGASDRS